MLLRTVLLLTLCGLPLVGRAEPQWVDYPGGAGLGQGRHIVFVSGDEEYRSEESLPQLAKILAVRHGFHCTVLFAVNKQTGEIDPQTLDNIPGLELLDKADLMVMLLRFRELPDEQMKHIMDYTNSGRPIVALRTSTHAFRYVKNKNDVYAKWTWDSKAPKGGYGREVLGETWISHYGKHQKESTRGVPAPGMQDCPILRGVKDVWAPSDVYGITTLSGDSRPVLMGQVLLGMQPDDKPNTEKPMLPVAWTKTYTGEQGKASRIFTTTMGHAHDLKNEGVRRVLVNACYWGLRMEDKIPACSNVELVGTYDPSPIHNGKHRPGVKPGDYALKP